MNKLTLLRRLLCGRALQNCVAVLVMAASVALAVTVLLLSSGLHSSITRAGQPFPLLMGAKGSPNQMVLSSIFLKDEPVGNISYEHLQQLRQDKNVAQAVPLGFGDNYKGLRIVGSEAGIFSFRGVGSGKPWLQLTAGRAFAAPGEAVLGAEAAKRSGLKLGDSFASAHGLVANANSKKHNDTYRVVGILQTVRGPYDSAIFVSMESLWRQHSRGRTAKAADKEVTAVLIRPAGYAASMQLAASYSKSSEVQVIFPAKSIIQLFSLMGNVEKLLQLLSVAVICLALLIIGSSLYWLMWGSLRQQAVMRALGAGVRQVMQLYFELGMVLVGAGLVIGVLSGHAIYSLLGVLLEQSAGLYLPQLLLPAEGLLAVMVLASGALYSALPAYILGRRDVAGAL